MTDRAKELRTMAEAATPGPWEACGEVWSRKIYADGESRVCFMAHSNGLNDDRDIATSELVAQAPTIALELADALDLLAKKDEELARLESDLLDRVLEGSVWAMPPGELATDEWRRGVTDARRDIAAAVRSTFAALTPVPHAGNGEGDPT